jgi:hypothetical protein
MILLHRGNEAAVFPFIGALRKDRKYMADEIWFLEKERQPNPFIHISQYGKSIFEGWQ